MPCQLESEDGHEDGGENGSGATTMGYQPGGASYRLAALHLGSMNRRYWMNDDFTIPQDRFDDPSYIEDRLMSVPLEARGSLRTALLYLYASDGPINLPRGRMKVAELFAEPRERVLLRWLYTRTNGILRATYGTKALHAARVARYRCTGCGFADVRALHIDHTNGRTIESECACLCANCHNIKSREHDWSGEKRY